MPKPILVGYDPEHFDKGPVRFGVAASQHTGAPLTIASAHPGSVTGQIGQGGMADDVSGEAGVVLKQLAQQLSSEGVKAEYWMLGGPSAPSMLHKAAEKIEAGMLVVGSTHQSRGGIVRPGSTAERLLHGAPCPVAVVPQDWESGGGLKIVGVAYVDTPEGRDAVRGAMALARRAGAKLRVLSAVEPKDYGRGVGKRPGAEASTYDAVGIEEQDATSGALRVIGDAKGMELEIDVSAQHPEDFLVAASERVDILICGSRGYGPRRAVLLGGVTRRVTREAHCPVIVLARETEYQLEELIGAPEPATA
jgi:nucleotide-binding universal stress UspA family protein